MWEIFAYQNSDSLFGIMNAAAAIHASNNYLSAVAAVSFCGFVAALVAYAFAPEKLQGWKWLGTVVLVFSVLILPKVTVGIVDKTGGSPVKVVANVPFGMAALGSITSTIGHTITELFETAFQVIPGAGALPSELAYSQNGLMFGNRLIRSASQLVFQDPALRTDLVNFLHNCTSYDLIDGTINPAIFSSSDNVWGLMATPNPARFTTLTNQSSSVTVEPCPNAYSNLDGRLPAQLSILQGKLAVSMNPTLSGAMANSVITGQIHQAYLKNSISSAAQTATDLIRQNAMLNVIEDSGRLASQKMNDPSTMMMAYGRSLSVSQKNASWINQGKVAEQALPVFRNVVEAIVYAMFPLMVLLLLLTSGRDTVMTFKGYATMLIWIQLWPPLYAVLNYMASIYAAYDFAAASDLGNGTKVLALQTVSTIYSQAISGEAIVGYLTISIPFIAWAMARRMEGLGTALVGGVTGLQSSIDGNTSSAIAGNINMGNVTMDQHQLAPNRTSAFMSTWQDDKTGDTFTTNIQTGRTAVSLLRNQGFASRVVSMQVGQQEVTEANRQVDAARSESVAANSERSAALSDAFSRGLSRVQSARSSSGTTASGFEEWGESLSKLDQITKNVSQTTGLSQSQVANVAFGAAAHFGIGTGKDFKPLSAGAQVDASLQKNFMAGLSSQEQKALSSMTNEQLSAFKQFGDRVSRDRSFASTIATDGREAQEMSARLFSATTRSQRADAALAERTAFAQRVSTAASTGETISIDIAQDPHNMAMFMRYAQQYGGDSASAQALMASELARQSLRPNRVFTDGTAVPTSFDTVREQGQKLRNDSSLAPNLDRIQQGNVQQTKGLVVAPPDQPSRAQPSTLRSNVRQRGVEILSNISSSSAGFDDKAEVLQTNDGTLKSKKSLTTQSLKQVGTDAKATIDNVSELIKDLKP